MPFQNFQDFRQEVGRLDFIKESLIQSTRVMKHIAAIVHGDEFMLILPLASLYNLEIFLRGGFESDSGTDELKKIYDFDVTFPMLDTPVKLQHAVVEEAHQLASALKWLHEDLTIFGSTDRYLAHMDLKPANILLIGDPRLPAGKWMLSDFGVSAFDKATNKRLSDTPSIGDVGHKFTSRGLQDRIVRGHGPYQPPEVDLEDVDNRKCDVWSLSCVLCDILAFAIGKTEVVDALRNSRYGRDDDDYFYKTNPPTGEKIKKIDESNTKVKSQIVEWWDSLEHSPAGSSAGWVIDYIKVLRQALRPKPSDRAGIREIVYGLNKLAPSIIAQANGSLATYSHPAPSVPKTNGLASQKNSVAPERRPSITVSHEPSPQNREGNDFGNAAPTDVNHANFSPNFLSPKSASQRKHVLPARHEGDGVHSPSSTGDHSAMHADTTNVAVDVPERRLPSSPDEPSPERHTAIVTIPAYREASTVSIPLPKKEHIKAVAIAPSTLQVAMLSKNSVYLYSTTGGREIGQPIILSSKVDWKKIRLASKYFAVYGLGPSLEKRVSRSLCYYDLAVKAHKYRLKYSTRKHSQRLKVLTRCPQRLSSQPRVQRPKTYFCLTKRYSHMSTCDLYGYILFGKSCDLAIAT